MFEALRKIFAHKHKWVSWHTMKVKGGKVVKTRACKKCGKVEPIPQKRSETIRKEGKK